MSSTEVTKNTKGTKSTKVAKNAEVANRAEVAKNPASPALLLSDADLYLFSRGEQEHAYRFMGANTRCVDGVDGVLFAVWAPAASQVAVVGDFNHWQPHAHVMHRHPGFGVWELFVPGVRAGMHYKYHILSEHGHLQPWKADPYAQAMQLRPDNASTVPDATVYQWQDEAWLERRSSGILHAESMLIYEVHAGSWRRHAHDSTFLDYHQLAMQLVAYVKEMGFTHIQLMPISEFPFDGSWGYQPIGLFAPTRRFGTPEQFRFFVDHAHQQGIGVLLDWVPAHFPSDEHGLSRFDGSCLYEHADPRQGFHPDWNTLIFNYGRSEVFSYLLSNAMYWLEEFHIDGLRVDAVASMLYLNYSRKDGEWLPNHYGGIENLEAIHLFREINERAYRKYPGIAMIAEESTAWPGVTEFTSRGGLGFGFKWNLGWMNDTLRYMARDPIHRKYHHADMSFGLLYAFSESFILALSHDEVVHGKRALLEKMPGDDWQKFANLRAYLGFMWAHPGKKLLFMGSEFAQRREWSHDRSLDWHLLDGNFQENAPHRGMQQLVRDLNHVATRVAALHALDDDSAGFEWVDADGESHCIFAFLRKCHGSTVLAVCNMTPTLHADFCIGVPGPGLYRELINTDGSEYGGSGVGNLGAVSAQPLLSHGREWSLQIIVPPLATLIFELENS